MERTERLLDLVALLLDAREPITWAELRESFPEDYGAPSDEAAERKFERDKAEILELGIPVAYVQGDDERKDGYVVDREKYYLPEVGLTPEELRAWRRKHPANRITMIRPNRAIARLAGRNPLGLFDGERGRRVYPLAYQHGLQLGERLQKGERA